MNGYYSVKEIAEKCGVSKPTVQRGIKELNIEAYKYKNKFLYDEKSAALIMRHISPKIETPKTEPENESERQKSQNYEKNQDINETQNSKNEKDETKRNKAETERDLILEILQKQIEEKDKMIDSLLHQNNILVQTNAFLSDTLEKTRESLLLSDKEYVPKEEKKSFWKSIFK